MIIIVSCSSPSKLLEKGQYDEALIKALKKIEKDNKQEFIEVADTAFKRLHSHDMDQFNRLSRSENALKYERMHRVAERLHNRQLDVSRYMPIYDKYGQAAQFSFVDTESMLASTARGAAEFYYQRGLDQLQIFNQTQDKVYARRAYDAFQDIYKYMRQYKDAEQQADAALAAGRSYIFIDVQNNSGVFTGSYMSDRLRQALELPSNDLWTVIDTYRKRATYDFNVQVALMQTEVSPDVYREFNDRYVEKVLEGERFLRDENGGFVIDSSGNRVTVPNEVDVFAEVLKIEQFKEAIIQGEISILDNRKDRVVQRERITARSDWENISCTWQGDRRALPNNIPRIGRPVDYPEDGYFVNDLITKLAPTIQDYISSITWYAIG